MKKILTLILASIFAICNFSLAKDVTVKLTHFKGQINVPLNPKRVVLLDYGVLDTIDALGVKPQMALPKRFLPSYLSQYKDEKYVDLGSLKEFNLEKVNAFKPDFIVISTRQKDYYDELSKIAPVYIVNRLPKNQMEEIQKDIINISKVFGLEDKAKIEIANINSQIEKVKAKANASNKKALFVLTNDGKISAYGSGSRFGFVHDTLEVKQVDENIKVTTHGGLVNYEYILVKNPDIIYVVDRSIAIGQESKATKLIKNPLVSKTKAAKNNLIINLDPQAWYLSGGGITTTKKMILEVDCAFEK